MEFERERESCTSLLSIPSVLKYQFVEDIDLKISDKCCLEMKEKPLKEWQKDNNKPNAILGLMADEKGRRETAKCIAFKRDGVNFSPLAKVSHEWVDWFIRQRNIELCELYYEPYNFKRTGCKGCPFNINLQKELETLETYFPAERKQCELIWKPVYEEYRKIGYRLKEEENIKLF